MTVPRDPAAAGHGARLPGPVTGDRNRGTAPPAPWDETERLVRGGGAAPAGHLKIPGRAEHSTRSVQCSGQFPAGNPSGFEFLRTRLKLLAFAREFLFQHDDALLELIEIRWGEEPGLALHLPTAL